jgi:hypothetical protein
MFRTFGLQALTGVSQPLFGDKLTAAMPIPQAGVDAIAQVANTAIYQVGDRITFDPYTANQDTLMVSKILTPTTMQVTSQGNAPQHAHAINAVMCLSLSVGELIIEPIDGGAGQVYLGSDNTVTAGGGGNTFYKLLKVAAGTMPNIFRATNSIAFNPVRTDDIWIAGSASDSYYAGAEII